MALEAEQASYYRYEKVGNCKLIYLLLAGDLTVRIQD